VNRSASAIWQGNRPQGAGLLSTESDALSKAPYSLDANIGTNPDELIAAALAASFSVALARELTLAGLHPASIHSTATATGDESIAGGMISHLQLNIRAKVPDSSQDQFVLAALAARASSPVVRLLKTTISMTAHLEVD